MEQNIRHHLTDDVLMAYSAGSLPEAFGLMVASHVSLCDSCRARVEAFDALGGALIEEDADVGAVAMTDSSFDATWALISGGPAVEAPKQRVKDSILPGPLQDYIGGDLADIKWRPVGMGVKQAILPTSDDASARLLFIPAGAAMPVHGHYGTEMTMVLQGAFADEKDYFGRGDVEMADQDFHHTPVADISEDCICLAVTDAPLKFNNLLPRIAQPFLRI